MPCSEPPTVALPIFRIAQERVGRACLGVIRLRAKGELGTVKAKERAAVKTALNEFSLKRPGSGCGQLACTRFRRHRVRCFYGTGGASWRDDVLRGSSSLRLFV